MKTEKIHLHYKIAAIVILVLGLIHVMATPLVIKDLALDKPTLDAFLFMFISAGLALVYAGLVLLKYLKQLKQYPTISRAIPLYTCSLSLFMGILACILMTDNPFSWITLLVGMYGFSIFVKHALILNHVGKKGQISTVIA